MEPRDVLMHLKQIPMFRDFDDEGDRELLRLVPFVDARTYSAGEQLLRSDQVPDRTIIVVSGRVRIEKPADAPEAHREVLGVRSAGAVLGRVSLRVGDFERLTVDTVDETEALILHFRDLVRAYQRSEYLREHLPGPLKPDVLVDTLKKIPLFSRLEDRMGDLELYQIAQITHDQVYQHGEWLFRQGEVSDRMIYVTEGQVQLTAINQQGVTLEVGLLGLGDIAGETGLLVGDYHDVTATAEGYARVLYLLRTELNDLIEKRPYLERRLNISPEVARRRNIRQFDWLREDEWVIASVQRHWVRLSRQAVAPAFVLLLLLPAVVMLLLTGQTILMALGGFLAIPILGLVAGIGWIYINWRDDYFVVTTQRVVHIERTGPFSTHQQESPLDNVVDISETQPGLMANLLDYGNLVLETAGETVDIDMSYVPAPDALRLLISRQVGRTKARDVLKTRGQIRDMLAHRLEPTEAPEQLPGISGPVQPRQPGRIELRVLLRSLWEYLFPPARIEIDDGNIIIWKRYWLPGVIWSAPALVPFLLFTIGGPFYLATRAGTPSFPGWLVAWLFVEAIAFAALLWYVEDWRNDYFQLTGSHIILVERLPLLLRETRRETRLDRIQNLSYVVPTIFARILDYGHVGFETAGTEGQFRLQWVRRPEDVQQTISNRQYEYRQHQIQAEANRRQQELLTWFATYDELHRAKES